MKIPCQKNMLRSTILYLVIVFLAMFLLILKCRALPPWYICLLMIFLFMIGVFYGTVLNRSYLLDSSGVTVYRLGRFSQHYRWEEFQTIRIAIIKVHTRDWYYPRYLILSKRLLPYPLVKPDYSWFEKHPFSTLLFEFTPERYVEFREKFPDIKLEWEDTNGSE